MKLHLGVALDNQIVSACSRRSFSGNFLLHPAWHSIFRQTVCTSTIVCSILLVNIPHLADADEMPASERLDPPKSEVRTSAFGNAPEDRLHSTYFTVGSGLAATGGLRSEVMMLNLLAGFSVRYDPSITTKVLADLSFGTGSDSSHFNYFAIGADYSPKSLKSSIIKPYFGGDIGYGIVRNISSTVGDGIAYAATVGFRAATEQKCFEVGLRYETLSNRVQDTRPSLLGLVLALNFD